MVGKIVIKSELKVLTGLHIGGSDAFSAIGAIDSPVVRDSRTNRPIIPGSSLKGKLRTLLARSLAKPGEKLPKHNDDNEIILRLFGSSGEPIIKSRLQFADAFVSNANEFNSISDLTEAKFENTIKRDTSEAMPRQIERVVSGVKFNVAICYDVMNESEIFEDMQYLARAMKLLQLDYLGGHGTRGSGRVSFNDFSFELYDCNIDINKLKDIFKEVEKYELLSIQT
ncbi:MAG TPA: type III-A CRISPR-associated RAMP protein Csm3 [Clostridiales bacterium]|nr:type III-A CRISPR-associated RAMP protein Csm3 [Clostridiales bacterium]